MKRTRSITGFLLAMILSLATFVGFKSVGATGVHAYGNQEKIVAGVSLPTLQDDHDLKSIIAFSQHFRIMVLP